MKKYLSIFAMLLTISSCNNEYLEKFPLDTQTEATAFKTNDNFRTFSWGHYETFSDDAYTQAITSYGTNYRGDMWAGYLSTYSTNDPNPYRLGNIISPTSGNGWNFSFIRRINLMLSNIDKSEMSQTDKDHWRSVGYFFRSFRYMELVSRFGDVPWVEQPISEEDTEIIYGKRDPRTTVTDNILANLQFAEKNIKVNGDGKNTINTNVVLALISRFGLFEGTWRKYHGIQGHEKFLDESIRASDLLIKAYPAISPSYDALSNSESLENYPGIILYKEYITDVLTHSSSHSERTSSGIYEMPKYTIESYLCNNGKPINHPTQTQYDGDKNMYDEFRNRDYRLLMTVVPPYCMQKDVIGGMNPPSFDYPTKNVWNTTGYYKANGVDLDEYVKKLKTILPSETAKRLPVFNWSGTMNRISPNISGPGQAPMASRSGYYVWKFYNLWETNSNMAVLNTADKPIFWIEEVLLNYAEAKFEKGEFNQSIADATINKLRPRADVAPMVIAEIDASFDPARDKTVDPVLWEIRRERMIELMGHGFGFQDIRRWKKGEWYINKVQVGTYIAKSDYVTFSANGPTKTTPAAWNNLNLVDKNFAPQTQEGYLRRFNNPLSIGKGWHEKYYLFAIPTNQFVLNKNLEQNPYWEK